MDADSDNPESVSDAESLSGLEPEKRQQHITSLLDKLTPTDTGYAEDIVYTERMPEDQRHPPVTVTVNGVVKKMRMTEIEYRILHEAYETVKDVLEKDAVIQRHKLEVILVSAEQAIRNRQLGIEDELRGESMFAGKDILDFTPEKRSQIHRLREDDNKVRSEKLNMLFNQFFEKLGPDADGSITKLPQLRELNDLTKFEQSLFRMSRPKLAGYVETNGSLPFSEAEKMFMQAMAIGSSVQDGEVVLQKLPAYRRPQKFEGFKRVKYEPPDELEGCTFTPHKASPRRPAPKKRLFRTPPSLSSAAGVKRDELLTSWQRKELRELDEGRKMRHSEYVNWLSPEFVSDMLRGANGKPLGEENHFESSSASHTEEIVPARSYRSWHTSTV